MEIIEKKIGDLKPYENNPRDNEDTVKYLKNSIEQFGFKVPIVIDADGVIVAGHTRLKAAEALDMKTVPCIVADDLTPEQIKAYRLADNRIADFSRWDYGKLDEELNALDGLDIDMLDFGFLKDGVEALREDAGSAYVGDGGIEPYNSDALAEKERTLKETPQEKKHTCPACGFEFEA